MSDTAESESFEAFLRADGPRLLRAFVARYGLETGRDVYGDVAERAWADWQRVSAMENPLGYLYRCGQSAGRRYWRWTRRIEFPVEDHWDDTSVAESGDVFAALKRLSADQRTAVVLVHAYAWSYREVADLLDVPVTSVTNHVNRGMKRLKRLLGERDG